MNKGDIVRLKSSDIKMTVRYIRTTRETMDSDDRPYSACCEWMDLDHRIQSHEFNISSLEKVSEDG